MLRPRLLALCALGLLGATAPSACRELAGHDPASPGSVDAGRDAGRDGPGDGSHADGRRDAAGDATDDASADGRGDGPLNDGLLDGITPDLGPPPPLVKGYGGSAEEVGRAVVGDGGGGAWIAGTVQCPPVPYPKVDVGDGTSRDCQGDVDILVMHVDALGTRDYVLVGGSANADSAFSVAADGSGGVWIGGVVRGDATFPGFPTIITKSAADIIVLHIGGTGAKTLLFAKNFGGPQDDGIEGVGVCRDRGSSPQGVWVTSSVRGAVTIGSVTPVALGGTDAIVFHLAPDGTVGDVLRWGSKKTAQKNYDYAYACAVDGQGDLLVGGKSGDGAAFKGPVGLEIKKLLAGAFRARYDPSTKKVVDVSLLSGTGTVRRVTTTGTESAVIGTFSGVFGVPGLLSFTATASAPRRLFRALRQQWHQSLRGWLCCQPRGRYRGGHSARQRRVVDRSWGRYQRQEPRLSSARRSVGELVAMAKRPARHPAAAPVSTRESRQQVGPRQRRERRALGNRARAERPDLDHRRLPRQPDVLHNKLISANGLDVLLLRVP